MKIYSAASGDLEAHISSMVQQFHPDLTDIRIAALFQFDDEVSDRHTLTHGGYPAAAVVRITNLRERALGVADAVIIVDRAEWQVLTTSQKAALIDHELTHLCRTMDDDTKRPKFDALGRPRLHMRQHDHQLGWFDEVAARHGEHSAEMRQAKQLLESTNQLYFEFGPPKIEDIPEKRVNLSQVREMLGEHGFHVSLGSLKDRPETDILAAVLWLEATAKLGLERTLASRPDWFPPL